MARTRCSKRGSSNGSARRSSTQQTKVRHLLSHGVSFPALRSTGRHTNQHVRLTRTAHDQTWAKCAPSCTGLPLKTAQTGRMAKTAATGWNPCVQESSSLRSTTTMRTPSSHITLRSSARPVQAPVQQLLSLAWPLCSWRLLSSERTLDET